MERGVAREHSARVEVTGKRIRRDHEFREELAACRLYRIPHSTLLGADPPGVWTDADQEKAIEYERYLAAICPECGTTNDDWIDPTTRRPLLPPLWEPWPERCQGCAARAKMQRTLPDGPDGDGLRVRIVPFNADRSLPDAMVRTVRVRREEIRDERPSDGQTRTRG